MPCDTQSIRCLNPVYSDTISDIEILLFDHIGDVILGGDGNTDPSRDTAQSKCFENFLESNSLHVCWDHALAIDSLCVLFVIFSRIGSHIIATKEYQCISYCVTSQIICRFFLSFFIIYSYLNCTCPCANKYYI